MKDSKQEKQFRLREVVSDLRFNYFCRAMKSGLSDAEARAELRETKVNKEILRVARAITQGKTLHIMLFYRCFIVVLLSGRDNLFYLLFLLTR